MRHDVKPGDRVRARDTANLRRLGIAGKVGTVLLPRRAYMLVEFAGSGGPQVRLFYDEAERLDGTE